MCKPHHKAVAPLNPYIGHSNPVTFIPICQGDDGDSLRSSTSQTSQHACLPGGLTLRPSRVNRRRGVPPIRAATSRTARSKNPSLSSGRGHWGHRRTPLPSSTLRMGRCVTLPRSRPRSSEVHFAALRCLASTDRW